MVSYCRTTSTSTAPCTSRRMCCPRHCATYCAPCQPLSRAFFLMDSISTSNRNPKHKQVVCLSSRWRASPLGGGKSPAVKGGAGARGPVVGQGTKVSLLGCTDLLRQGSLIQSWRFGFPNPACELEKSLPGKHRSQEAPPLYDPTVALCLVPYGSPRVGCCLL